MLDNVNNNNNNNNNDNNNNNIQKILACSLEYFIKIYLGYMQPRKSLTCSFATVRLVGSQLVTCSVKALQIVDSELASLQCDRLATH